MALYSFRGQYVGITHTLKSCVGAAAYRAGERLVDPRSEEVHDYTDKHVVQSEILAPEDAPEWVHDRQTLWGNAERARNRVLGVTAREIRIALPRELTREEQVALMRAYLREEFVSQGIVVDWSLHDEEGKNQPHVHVMLTTRELKSEGFGKKVRAWDHRALYNRWREQWAVHANRALELAGHEERIDHRSYKERGIDLEPQTKLYRHADDVHADGRDLSARMEEVRRIARDNGARILQDPTIPLRMLTHQRATFRREDVLKVLNTHTADAEQFTRCLEVVMASPELVELPTGRYTTREMLAVEKRMMDAADALAVRSAHEVDERHIERAIARADDRLQEEAHARGDAPSRVSEEQRRAIAHLTRATGALALLEGHAGTGKSFLLGVAREAWEAEGYTVIGGALAGKAAEGLETSSGIISRTLASWERAWALDVDALTDKHVLVVDEAGMLGTRQLGRVLDHARLAGAKVVLVGDSRQLQAIEAGSPFRALSERLGAETLAEIRRQRLDWQREASRAFAEGRAQEALEGYLERGHVKAHRTSEEARVAVVRAWTEGLSTTPIEKQMMFAYRRADVHALNLAAREMRRAQGALGKDVEVTTEVGARVFARGDRVYFGKNDRHLGVKNGTLGTVEQVGVHRMTVRLDAEGIGRLVQVDFRTYQHLDHGYAVTVHKGQGATVDRSYVLASKLFDSAKSYVSLSRQREHAELHWARDEFGTTRAMMHVLTRTLTKELALEQLAAERVFSLDEVLADPRKFEVLGPVEQRRMIEQAAGRAKEMGPALSVEARRAAWVETQPEVVAAEKALEEAASARMKAEEALEEHRDKSWLERRGVDVRALEHDQKAAESVERSARDAVRDAKVDPAVLGRAEKELQGHNQRLATMHTLVRDWRARVVSVEREGVREDYLERVQAEVKRGVRWAAESDLGKAFKVVEVLPRPYVVDGREQRVVLLAAEDGALVMAECRAWDASKLVRGVELSLGARRAGLELRYCV